MKLRLHEEMWAWQHGDEWFLSRPWCIDRKTGKSLPGFVSVPVRVLEEGTIVEVSS